MQEMDLFNDNKKRAAEVNKSISANIYENKTLREKIEIYRDKYNNNSFSKFDTYNCLSDLISLINNYNNLNDEYKKIVKYSNDLLKEYENLQKQCNNNIKQIKELKSKITITPKKQQIKDSDIEKIKELRKQGLSYSKIVKETGWSKFTVGRVINGFYDK